MTERGENRFPLTFGVSTIEASPGMPVKVRTTASFPQGVRVHVIVNNRDTGSFEGHIDQAEVWFAGWLNGWLARSL